MAAEVNLVSYSTLNIVHVSAVTDHCLAKQNRTNEPLIKDWQINERNPKEEKKTISPK